MSNYPTPDSSSFHSAPSDYNIYLRLGDATLENYSFNHMIATHGPSAWMDDSALNMSLEALRHSLNCAPHSIDILSSNLSQLCFAITDPREASHPSNNALRARFHDMRWILMPINDGFDGEELSDEGAGSHWSLAIIDRGQKRRYYYDSMWGPGNYIESMAERATAGFLMLVGEDTSAYAWWPQVDCPDQREDNLDAWDEGPCGAFVWYMSEHFVRVIRGRSKADDFDLCIGAAFRGAFRQRFHSGDVKRDMRDLIERYRKLQGVVDEDFLGDMGDLRGMVIEEDPERFGELLDDETMASLNAYDRLNRLDMPDPWPQLLLEE
ncbi:hypothetical protein GQ44DRAFT_713075 [Phaeosphaeriaceae sp. PMI808]|nr:hypothetical protein GQ44DRAFT_713075 [Phaeosphaeriaceae sp. PMI808]